MDSDDVSALSMDGASAIAGKARARRMRRAHEDFAKMQIGIPEIEEEAPSQHQSHAEEGSRSRSRQSPRPLEEEHIRTTGEELIEPFPHMYEEWQRKKERRRKKKDKKERKSRKSGKGSRSSKSREEAPVSEPVEGRKAPPIMEIAICSTNIHDGPSKEHRRSLGPSNDHSSDLRSYPSMAESTTSSSYTRSRMGTSSHSQSRRHSSSLTHESGGALGATVQRTLDRQASLERRSSMQSTERRPSLCLSTRSADSLGYLSHLTGNSHMTGQSTVHSQRTVTAEDLHRVRKKLEKAREEENKVVDIHQRLLREVQLATEKADRANDRRRAVALELETSSVERAEFQRQLALLEEENERLRKTLRRLEEKETERGLDDIIDSMEAKIKALKKQGQRSKEKKEKKELKRRASLDKR